MKTVILYTSSHGTTKKAATLLKEKLNSDTELINLKRNSNPDISGYDLVLIGSSIHAGSIPGRVKRFLKDNQTILISKNTGFFLCCMEEGDKAEKQFNDAFPQDLRDAACANAIFGGEFVFSKMNFVQKAIIKKISGATEDVHKLSSDEISRFAEKINSVT